MATPAQALANLANAQHSTGPRTAEGKATSASNGTTTGLTSRTTFIRPDEQEEFDELKVDLLEELQPGGHLQNHLFDRILHATWNLRRCHGLEAKLQEEAFSKGLDDATEDDELAARLDRLYRYKKMHESSHRKALAELRLLQTEQVWRREHQDLTEESVLVDTGKIMKYLRQRNAVEEKELSNLAERKIIAYITAPPPTTQRK